MATLKEQIDERFIKAIRKTFNPCPLIGPRWLQEFPRGKPADFRYFGIRKLAKATGRPTKGIAKTLLRSVSMKGLGLEMNLLENGLVDINRIAGGDESDETCCPPTAAHDTSPKKKGAKSPKASPAKAKE